MFDVRSFLDDYDIPYKTEGKNTQKGWVNIQCPFPECGDSSNHGGFNLNTGHYSCWNCGHHWLDKVVAELINVRVYEAREIINRYEKMSGFREEPIKQNKKEIEKGAKLKFPASCGELTNHHKKYLINRGYDPEQLVVDWKIKGTKNLGNYCNRIIVPIYLDGIPVSYLGRDITGKHSLRYMTCEKEDELIFHKYIIYGIDEVKFRRGIVVEGVFDVWRIGKGAVATFGDAWTKEQALFLSKRLDEIFILYDDGAEKQSLELYTLLKAIMSSTKTVELLKLEKIKDPDELQALDVLDLRKKILKY